MSHVNSSTVMSGRLENTVGPNNAALSNQIWKRYKTVMSSMFAR